VFFGVFLGFLGFAVIWWCFVICWCMGVALRVFGFVVYCVMILVVYWFVTCGGFLCLFGGVLYLLFD